MNDEDNATDNPYAATVVEDDHRRRSSLARLKRIVWSGLAYIAVCTMFLLGAAVLGLYFVRAFGLVILLLVLGVVCFILLEGLTASRPQE